MPESGESKLKVMDSMTCLCGEVLSGVRGEGGLAKQYQEHMKREDHKASPAQWATAHERIEANKEKAKSRQ